MRGMPSCYFSRDEYALPKDRYSPVFPASEHILCLLLSLACKEKFHKEKDSDFQKDKVIYLSEE